MKKSIPERFKPQEFEQKWQKIWEEKGIYSPDLARSKKPYYNLMMFPYPSAEGLHVGNVYAFTGVDVTGRFKRMQGYNVFEPMGLDGFGIHSENYALKVNKHPKEQAKISAHNFYRQLRSIGNGFDFRHTLETYDPDYYRWTQWIFVQMFKQGLAYRAKAAVNYCPSCKTVLADEQVIGKKVDKVNRVDEVDKGTEEKVCERCGTEVVIKDLEQWFFRITEYAEKLLQNTYKPQFKWSEKVKIGQQKWIGRSEGVQIEFIVRSSKLKVSVYTTALDTIYGVTFMVLSPKHSLIKQLDFPDEHKQNVLKYINEHQNNTKEELNKEKSGVFTGLYLINPINNKPVPIWIADYVLMEYGTGAVMGVPGHDRRDHDFAKKYKLPIIPVIKPIKEYQTKAKVELDGFWDYKEIENEFADKSILFNSNELNGLTSAGAKKKLEEIIIKNDIGKKEVHYHLRDWLISRQRYWGAPIPMIYCQRCADKSLGWLNRQKKNKHKENSNNQAPNTKQITISNIQSSKEIGAWNLEFENSMKGWFPVPEDQLPVLLPDVKDWRPTGTGRGPLAAHPEFYKTKCPNCGGQAVRETDVCDTFLDSAWYYLRYPFVNAGNSKSNPPAGGLNSKKIQRLKNQNSNKNVMLERSDSISNMKYESYKDSITHQAKLDSFQNDMILPWNNDVTKLWFPVDSYIGGAEHTVLHLLYTRFVYMALIDWGLLEVAKPIKEEFIANEPFKRFYAHGLIIKDGAKMSKSKGNIVVPDEYIKLYGADTLRTYLMFLGPFDSGGDFRDTGIAGMYKWLSRVWRLVSEIANLPQTNLVSASPEAKKLINFTIKFITEELQNLRYNTAIAKMMEFTNWWMDHPGEIDQTTAKDFIKLLAPFAPHMTEELYQQFEVRSSKFDEDDRAFGSIHQAKWPVFDEKILVKSNVKMIIQINGKMRDVVVLSTQIANQQNQVEQSVKKSAKILKWLGRAKIKKVIFVPGRLINFVL